MQEEEMARAFIQEQTFSLRHLIITDESLLDMDDGRETFGKPPSLINIIRTAKLNTSFNSSINSDFQQECESVSGDDTLSDNREFANLNLSKLSLNENVAIGVMLESSSFRLPLETTNKQNDLQAFRTSNSAPKNLGDGPSRDSEPIMLGVGHDRTLPLRGSEETWKAIQDGNITITMCLFCNIDLHCIDDAQLVICPECCYLSPVDQVDNPEQFDRGIQRHGVGVGVKAEDVIRWLEGHAE